MSQPSQNMRSSKKKKALSAIVKHDKAQSNGAFGNHANAIYSAAEAAAATHHHWQP